MEQDAKFGERERNRDRTGGRLDRGKMRSAINAQAADAQHFRLGRPCPAQHDPHPCDDFERIEGLHDIVVGAGAQALELVEILIERGKHDHRGLAAPAQFREHAPAIEARHHDIEQHEIRAQRQMQIERAAPVAGMDLSLIHI